MEACLLDYGNTVVEFDHRQIDGILSRFGKELARRLPAVSLDTLRSATQEVCSIPHRGSPPDYRELDPEDLIRRVLGELYGPDCRVDPSEVARLNRRFQDLFVESIDPVPETRELFSRLRSGVRLGVVSNYPCGEAIRRSLRRVGLDDVLDPVVVSGDVGFVKPHDRVFRVALDAMGLPAERVLFVGDRWDADMLGAHRVGMPTCHHVGFTSDGDWAERYETYRPDFVIRRLEELEDVLRGRRPASSGAAGTKE